MTATVPPLVTTKLDVVRSPWRASPLKIDGSLSPKEWQNYGQLPIPKGFLLVQNDAEWLYLALDLVEDMGNDANDDYFWLMIDVDRNSKPTPYHDVLFSVPPNDPNRLGRWLMVGPGACVPTSDTFRIESKVRQGFGPSAHTRHDHRIWELAIKLDEIGIDLKPFDRPPAIRFGVHLASGTPAFTADTPPRAFNDFSHFHTIVLSTHYTPYPKPLTGKVIGGVGFIPATKIGANGLATNDYAGLAIVNAAFGGTLQFLENVETIHDLVESGARTFLVRHRFGIDDAALAAAAWEPLLTTWSNYRWTGTTYVLESFGPTAIGHYRLVDPAVDYSIKALLFSWNTAGAPDVLHQFELDFYDGSGAKMAAPKQTMTLRIDNRAPNVDLIDVKHGNAVVQPCEIVEMSSATDDVSVTFRAYDGEGLLDYYNVTARWGDDQAKTIASDTYAAHTASPVWLGEVSKSVDFRPAVTCAYQFQVRATGRVTNGYHRLQWNEAYQNVTLKVPASPVIAKVSKKMAPAAPMLPRGLAK